MVPSLTLLVSALPLLSWLDPTASGMDPPWHSSPRTPITLRFGLTQPYFHQIEFALLEISDPSSPRWTEHLSKEEVEDIILLESFLVSHGIDITGDALQRTPASDWISLKTNIEIAEKLLDTTYSIYANHETRLTTIRTTSYSLPAHLHDHIDVVQPTNYSPSVDDGAFNQQSAPAPVPSPQPNMSLPELKTLYRTDAYKAKGTRSSIGITRYLEQYANLADLKQFYSIFHPPALKSTLHVGLINGKYPYIWSRPNTNRSISYEDNGNEP
ncbi:Pro-kumamolisin, activation domain-containing protein [Cantharellus anzutake]|uniref:Pro-kumamolisin, activation domain-containing protein n=1 Tax=Cantharellus anzutake TaxID=1750568 RepID=UPI001905760D|nr:Pro-kumamolisin, activation domain-containing protein [Cantharellus anzutake]KAF8340256.1 Pro-kumamolisin, activation domain-containing protein [Cantharellus anzutake]